MATRFVRWGLLANALVFIPWGAAGAYVTQNAFPSIAFTNPVCIASPPGETNRLFIVEKKGKIVVITNLASPSRSIFMDISSSSQVISATDTSFSGEEGLLGMAFHPGYATNGYFYVFYTGTATTGAGSGRHDILSRFQVSAGNTNQGNAASEVRYIVQYDQADNHNSGDLHFGPDGYLYVSLGDEGGSYGQWGNTQKITNDFFSAIMRIDVDMRAGTLPPNSHPTALPSLTNYAIPADNPYVGASSFNGYPILDASRIRTEFWAVGMRNPWRFIFDPVSGDLLLGHVGQSAVEWVNVVTKGFNAGWNYYEGSRQWTNTAQLPPGLVRTPPLIEYGHTNGRNCVIGGVVYRGSRMAALYGSYLYADYGSGEIWALRHTGTNVTQNLVLLADSTAHWSAFGTDPRNGDVLVAAVRGGISSTIERIIASPAIAPLALGIGDFRLIGTNVRITATSGVPSGTFYLVTSSALTPPWSNWETISTNSFDSSGAATVTNAFDPALGQKFYILRLP
jgi:glucose/arabinose dehydrogenase